MKSPSAWQWMNHRALDKSRWDKTIADSQGPVMYGLSQYLTLLCDDWDALVYDNYAAVMPLPVRRKLGIPYLYQPWGLAQGGIFSPTPLAPGLQQQMLAEAMRHYRYGTIDLHAGTQAPAGPGIQVSMRTNYVLPLHTSYTSLQQAYAPDTQKNLRRAARFHPGIRPCHDVQVIAQLYKQAYGHKNVEANGSSMQQLVQAAQWLMDQGYAFACTVHSHQGQHITAGAVFGHYAHRIYYLLGAPTAEGRQQKSMYFLLDHIIRQYAGQEVLFDFEGSDIPSVASFYQRFGAQNQPYPSVHINQLPWPLRLLKP